MIKIIVIVNLKHSYLEKKYAQKLTKMAIYNRYYLLC